MEFEMVDGVFQVWAGPSREEAPVFGPPGSAVDFFSDMHWLLKTISLGHVRSFTHHRLLLLEQKFNLHAMLNAGGPALGWMRGCGQHATCFWGAC